MRSRKPGIPLFTPPVDESDVRAVTAVLRRGWLTTGPVAALFEKTFARRLGVKYAVAVSSGTMGLQVALDACGVGPRSEVITTPLTFAATVEAIMRLGARPVLADIEPGALGIDPAAIERRIGRQTRAIIPVGVGGIPCEVAQIRKLARAHRLTVIEDAAHTLGASYHGLSIGRWADATAFSFYATKNITSGEGGMVVTDVKKRADAVRRLVQHGITRPTWVRRQHNDYRYDVTVLGYKGNMSDMAAALGLSQLRRFDRLMQQRRRLAARYHDDLADCDLVAWPHVPQAAEPSWHLCQVLLRIERLCLSRDAVWDRLRRQGIACGVHFIPLYRLSYFRRALGLRRRDFPATERAFQRVLTLPLFPTMTLRQVDDVAGRLIEVLRRSRR